jgi:hypothetical protein
MGSDETAAACYEYFHVGWFIAGCSMGMAVLVWYYRIEMNATLDVGCKREETTVSCTRGLFVYGANIPCAKSFTGVRR